MMLRSLYDSVLALAASRHAPAWLMVISFAESSFFPIPPDALLIPMCLARPDRALRYAAMCTVASVGGGLFGYLIGYGLFELLAAPLIALYNYEAAFQQFKAMYDEYGLWVVLIGGFTPVPYKIVTIASGAASFNLPLFIVSSILARGARFFIVAFLLQRYGERMRAFIEQRLALLTVLGAAGVILGFASLKLL
jgi:membrane protein YqaA with SNARE-associated domain